MQKELFNSLSQQQLTEKSTLQVRLLKGPLYRAKQRDLWQCLERDQYLIREYFQQIGLSLVLDNAEGYAYLKQMDFETPDGVTEPEKEEILEIPRLISRRAMSFGHTLLIVLLRKRLAEHDSEDSSPRLIVSRTEIHQWLQPYYPTVSNEIKQRRDFDGLIKKVIEMGFLSTLINHQDDFEVQRIIKALVNAEEIVAILEKLKDSAVNKSVTQSVTHSSKKETLPTENKNNG
ncbi:MAG: DUF4194 domain-containing protein [Gammaproteobacteria bacterium]|nr:DUF4194 domain-containing protein [Gammaproteobacteria bacterium]